MSDLIDRQAALSVVGFAMADSPSITREDWNAIFDALAGVPSAQPERKKGKWNKVHWKAFRCSECKQLNEFLADFCPSCGARMEGLDETD